MAKILIVDDDEDFLDLTSRRLRRAGHETTTCAAAREVPLVVLAEPFDMLLLDLNMPDLNGPDLLALLRNMKAFAKIRVIILSSADEQELRRTAARFHAEYLSKSAPKNELLSVVARSLSLAPKPSPKF